MKALVAAGSFARFFARSSALICGRCLVGESATRRGFEWRRMAL